MNSPKTHVTPTKPPLAPAGSPPSAAGRPSCASCKHQRRRCSPYCPLAAYFPANKQREFLNVHRLFGVKYVLKLLKTTPPHRHDAAVKSLIYEANLRAANPVGGCYAAIRDLQKQIDFCNAQLQIVTKILAYHRSRFLHNFDYDRKPS